MPGKASSSSRRVPNLQRSLGTPTMIQAAFEGKGTGMRCLPISMSILMPPGGTAPLRNGPRPATYEEREARKVAQYPDSMFLRPGGGISPGATERFGSELRAMLANSDIGDRKSEIAGSVFTSEVSIASVDITASISTTTTPTIVPMAGLVGVNYGGHAIVSNQLKIGTSGLYEVSISGDVTPSFSTVTYRFYTNAISTGLRIVLTPTMTHSPAFFREFFNLRAGDSVDVRASSDVPDGNNMVDGRLQIVRLGNYQGA